MTLEEKQAMQRGTDFVVRDAKRWQAEAGDLAAPWEDAQGHLAIVIDDVGRELHLFEKLLALRFRLTFAVLPASIYSAGTQLRLQDDHRRYREILLHLPMEPHDASQMTQGAEAAETFLLVEDDATTLHRKVELAMRRVPAAIGVNNHMGSRLTTDRMAMDVVMAAVHEQAMFFLDSRTDAATQAEHAAHGVGVPVLSREVFLDNDPSESAIEAQLEHAAALSRDHPVVAIGHPSAPLHAVLERRLPELHRQGVSVYPLSHLLDHD
jgi:hypothetical protein